MRLLPITLLAWLTLATAAHAAAPKPHPFRVAIAPGKVGEVCMKLDAGDRLAWRFKADTAVDFNLHHHVGTEVLMPVERKAIREDRAEHPIDQLNDWCLMWTAPAARRATIDGSWTQRKPAAASAPP